MTTPPQPTVQELRDEFNCQFPSDTWETFEKAIDRLEAAEARVEELKQLMARGWSKARKHELECVHLRTELYRTQMVLEGQSRDFCTSPMAIQARPPVDDVSSILIERLKRDADRIVELETAQQTRTMTLTRWGDSKPNPGREFILYEVYDDEPILADMRANGSVHTSVNGLSDHFESWTNLNDPQQGRSLWCYVPDAPDWSADINEDGEEVWQTTGLPLPDQSEVKK